MSRMCVLFIGVKTYCLMESSSLGVPIHWVSVFTGMDYWTGLLTGLKIYPQNLVSCTTKSYFCPDLKLCPSLRDIYLVQCNLSI